MEDEIRTVLMRTPLFRELSDTSIALIAESASRQVFQRESIIYEQGTAATELYVLAEGEVALQLMTSNDRSLELERRRAPDVFGEAAIWDDGPRMVTARATETTSVLVIRRKVLEPLLGPESRFVRDLLGYLAGVLRGANERIRELEAGG